MRAFILFTAISLPVISWAQVQSKSQCMTTVRARSMSISSADAEKLCADDYSEVVNCAITQSQSRAGGNMEDRLKVCRDQMGLKTLRQDPKPTPTPSPSPAVVKVPVEDIEVEEDQPVQKEHKPVFEPIPDP
jgi:predicted membrane-bound mannosyltransferase